MFIHPGYEFRVVGALLTNFHLPRVDPADAGLRVRREGPRAGCLSPRRRAGVSLLLLWGLHVRGVNGQTVACCTYPSPLSCAYNFRGAVHESTSRARKQVALQDFVSKLREFPESAFEHTQEIVDFLDRTLASLPTRLTPYPDLGSPALHPQPHRQDTVLRTDCDLLGESARPVRFTIIATRTAGWPSPSAACWSRIIRLVFQDIEEGQVRTGDRQTRWR